MNPIVGMFVTFAELWIIGGLLAILLKRLSRKNIKVV